MCATEIPFSQISLCPISHFRESAFFFAFPESFFSSSCKSVNPESFFTSSRAHQLSVCGIWEQEGYHWNRSDFVDYFVNSVKSEDLQLVLEANSRADVILANLIGYFAARSLATIMGIIRSCFSFIAGNVFGIYIAQNYQVPNLKKVADNVLLRAKEVDRKYRKPKKKGGDDE